MAPSTVRGLNSYRDDVKGIPNNLYYLPAKTHEVADSVIDSLMASNDLVPSQWVGMLRRRVESRELRLLWEVFFTAWEDLGSPRECIRAEAESFFTRPEAGEPLSLRFLCDALELDLKAVKAMARARIAAGMQKGARQRRNWSRPRYISSPPNAPPGSGATTRTLARGRSSSRAMTCWSTNGCWTALQTTTPPVSGAARKQCGSMAKWVTMGKL